MKIVTLDFETYFDDLYTLKKQTTEEYIRDRRFEALGVAIAAAGEKAYWVPQEHISGHLNQFDWSTIACLCHHSHFDGLILSHHYGIKPHAWLDTLGMARLLLGNHVSVALGSLAAYFGLAAKTVPYDSFRGRHWSELDVATRALVGSGACHDVELTWRIFTELAKTFPAEEYQVVDTTVRFFTEPTLIGDIEELGKVWTNERDRKVALLQELAVDVSQLQSADKFVALLQQEGVEPPNKAGKSGPIPAIAKSDKFMKDLLEHENPRVAALAAARLGVKSTIMQTRAERMGWMSRRGIP